MGTAFILLASFSPNCQPVCSFVVQQAPHLFAEFQPNPDKNPEYSTLICLFALSPSLYLFFLFKVLSHQRQLPPQQAARSSRRRYTYIYREASARRPRFVAASNLWAAMLFHCLVVTGEEGVNVPHGACFHCLTPFILFLSETVGLSRIPDFRVLRGGILQTSVFFDWNQCICDL